MTTIHLTVNLVRMITLGHCGIRVRRSVTPSMNAGCLSRNLGFRSPRNASSVRGPALLPAGIGSAGLVPLPTAISCPLAEDERGALANRAR